jgi:nonsense-mediated mRNA decay protein 3
MSVQIELGNDKARMSEDEEEISKIPCCLCETFIVPNDANMCAKCLNDQVDISEGISKDLTIFRCRSCLMWFRNPQWVRADLESPELLTLCLKKLRGLSKVKLIDAGFVWTEPHSKRMIVKLTIQANAVGNAILQKKFRVDITIANKQCFNCQKSFTAHIWDACVQVRQKVAHKRTFLYLEQLILKHGMTAACMGIAEQPFGLDFFFDHRSKGQHFVDFLNSCAPIKSKTSKRLISSDSKSNLFRFKYTIYAEISSPCKDDLVCLPIKLCRKKGGVSPLLIVRKITSSIHLLDPMTLEEVVLSPGVYFDEGGAFGSLATRATTANYIVMDIVKKPKKFGKLQLAEVELVPEALIGDESKVVQTFTHLGQILKVGDLVACYESAALRLDQHDDLNWWLKKSGLPSVIPIRKIYARRRRRR